DSMLKKVESHAGPLFVYLTHFFEHTVATLVASHESQEANVELQRTGSCLLELLSKLRWIHEGALLGRRIHPRGLVPFQMFGRIGKRDICYAGRKSRVIENLPNRPGPAGAGIRITKRIAVRLRFQEMKNSMFPGVLSGRERSPGWRCYRRKNGLEFT